MIKYLIIDVDGTLTDGRVYIGQEGELCKAFYVRDGLGIQRAIKHGITPIILTSRESDIVIHRCKELGIKEIYQGAPDKELALKDIIKNHDISTDELAYIADDVNDYKAMMLAGLRACPNDAAVEIRRICHFVCIANGGQGAVRELCDWLIEMLAAD